jgi:TRAP-type uncharacterized transport system fused permease subunit
VTRENEYTPLPPGPAAAAAEAAARSRATDEVLDLGEVSREAILRRALPVVAAFAAAGVVIGVLSRRRR